MRDRNNVDFVLDIIQITIVVIIAYVLINALFLLGNEQEIKEIRLEEERPRSCNICIQEPYLTIISIQVSLVLVMLYLIVIASYRKEVKDDSK